MRIKAPGEVELEIVPTKKNLENWHREMASSMFFMRPVDHSKFKVRPKRKK